jgi:glycosyltransferase involved in cell wall biosynthesis
VLLEAMAAGAAIVASELSGYRLVARPDVDGLLVPPGDVDALADALNLVLREPARRAALVASGAERADHYSMDRLADAYLALYERVCTPAPTARGWRRPRSSARRS